MSRKNITDDKKVYETFGKALKEARLNNGYKKQNKFAEAINELQPVVSRWENSNMEPMDHNQKKIQQVLNKYITPVKGGWVILDESERDGAQIHIKDSENDQDLARFRLAEKEIDKVQEPGLDYLPLIVRLRDKLDEKIQKLTGRKFDSDKD